MPSMGVQRYKLIRFGVVVLGIVAIAVAGFALRRPVLERWYVWQLESEVGSWLNGLKDNHEYLEDREERYFLPVSNGFGRETTIEIVRLGKDAVPALLEALESEDVEIRQMSRRVLPAVTGVRFGPDPISYQQATDPSIWGKIVSEYKRWWWENGDKKRTEWVLAAIESGEGNSPFTSWMGAFSYLLAVSGIEDLEEKLGPVLVPLAPEYALSGCYFPKALFRAVHDRESRRGIAEIARRTVEELGIADL